MDGISDHVPLSALVLAGGKSRRMGMDKANLCYSDDGMPQWKRMTGILAPVCQRACVSIRREQELDQFEEGDAEQVVDGPESKGPLSGILQAAALYPTSAWLVVACDLPLLEFPVIEHLLQHRGDAQAVAYRSSHDGLPEPMCAIYETSFIPVLQAALDNDMRCPRKILINNPDRVRLLELPDEKALENANTPEEFRQLKDLALARNS
ncbi:MAG: molybdenum cofactor guanylyltransferase [Puniceicoccaceae bacterium]